MSIQREGPSRHSQVYARQQCIFRRHIRKEKEKHTTVETVDLQEGDEGLGELELFGRGRSRALLLVVLEDGRLTPIVDVRGVVSRAVVHTGVTKPSVTSHHRR